MIKLNRQAIITALLIILPIATAAFIWSNSLPSIQESAKESASITKLIKPILEIFVGQGNVTNHLVRKLAHFAEFTVMGFELAIIAYVRKRLDFQAIINSLFTALLVALIDETIQIYFKRGSKVSDVWLDFAGAVTGVLLALLLRSLVGFATRRKRTDAMR